MVLRTSNNPSAVGSKGRKKLKTTKTMVLSTKECNVLPSIDAERENVLQVFHCFILYLRELDNDAPMGLPERVGVSAKSPGLAPWACKCRPPLGLGYRLCHIINL